MHIPDGFLSPPVWSTLDLAAAACVTVAARRAQNQLHKIPLLGVMGAFVFGAQMINFPLAAGTSAHLVGGALMAVTLGPWAASLVMCAVLILQAFLFQDGGLLALGANIVNMAMLGVLAAYLPCRLFRRTPFAIFLAGLCSVLCSAAAAMLELHASGIALPRPLLASSSLLFLAMGLVEGAITVAVVRSIRTLGFPEQENLPEQKSLNMFWWIAAALLLLFGIAFASGAPDVLEGILKISPADLHWSRKALAMSLLGACFLLGARFLTRRKSVQP